MRREVFLRHGFTLIEMVVVIAIVIALAGILVPIVTNEIDDAKRATAQAALNRISTAVSQYTKDTTFPPTGPDGAKTFHFLAGQGTLPEENKFDSGPQGRLEDFLAKNASGTKVWKGPYLQDVEADPWGRCFLVNVHGFLNGKERVWVLSAGPNQRVETNPKNTTLGGDDLGMYVD
jgi:prepilin-type N-terminal cleavage/methylation domain-containing protein